MGICKYCGEPAGLLRAEHPACANAHTEKLCHAQEQRQEALRNTQNRIINALESGVLPEWRGTVPPVNLVDGEKVVLVFFGVEYLRDKKQRVYSGVYGGPSVRVFRDVSVRAGAFRGTPNASISRISLGIGDLILTTKNLYFYSQNSSLRVPYRKIASFIPFANGAGIVQDRAESLPHIFVTGSNFVFKALTNISRLASGLKSRASASENSLEALSLSEINDPDLDDALYSNAIDVVVRTQSATVSGIQRRLRISYRLANQLIELMESDGIVSAKAENGTRTVLRRTDS